MKASVIILMTIVSLSLLTACKKGDNNVISGYTARDNQGVHQAGTSNDASDWGYNQTIPSQIETMLKGLPMQASPCTNNECSVFDPLDPNGVVTTSAYPNPCTSSFTFHALLHGQNYACVFVVVDQNLHVYESGATNGSSHTYIVNVQSLAPGLYRVYYMYINSQSQVLYKGYGDVLKQ